MMILNCAVSVHRSILRLYCLKKNSVNRNQFMSQFKIIEKEVRSIFSMLRKESIASEDYKVILFLLSLVKDEVLSKDHHENINDITVLVDRRLEASSQELQMCIYQFMMSFDHH